MFAKTVWSPDYGWLYHFEEYIYKTEQGELVSLLNPTHPKYNEKRMAQFSFDSTTIADNGGDYKPLPEGLYLAEMTESDMKQTRSGGWMISAKFNIIQPEAQKNRVVFHNFNVENQNPKAVEIGLQQLKRCAEAVAKQRFEDTSELHNIPLTLDVEIQPEQNGYKAQNRIKKFGNVNEYPVQKAAAEHVKDDICF